MTITSSGTFEVVNPATGEPAGRYPVHTAGDVARAVARAGEAQRWWEGLGPGGRRPYLQRWVRWLARHCDEVYGTGHRETARPAPFSRRRGCSWPRLRRF